MFITSHISIMPIFFLAGGTVSKELENSPDHSHHPSRKSAFTDRTEAFRGHFGRYSCFASNIYGTDSTSAEIYRR